MYLFFMKTLFLFCMWNLCKGSGPYEKSSEFTESDISLSKNESYGWSENTLTELLREQPNTIVLELRESLLEKVKAILRQESETNIPVQRTTLVTFHSMGLQDVTVYNNTSDIRQAIMNLEPTPDEREISPPTIQVLGEVLQKEMPEGFILLLTTSKASDEYFAENLVRSLMEKRCQLSILWAGNYHTDEYLTLKDMAERSGGRFGFIMSDGDSDENVSEQEYPKLQFENLAEQIKFPEDEYNATEEIPMVSRAADQKTIQKTVVPLIIEVASGTSLEARPGSTTQIQFTVKNNLNALVHILFSAKYNGILQSVQPNRAVLQPSATVTVNVILNLFALGAPQTTSAVGTVTLVAEAANKIMARSALISLAPETVTDYTAPKMTYRYNGDCANYKEPQNCEQGQWNLEATLHDENSGLLKVLSEPYGLLFQSEFIAGTKSPVTVYYSATCCQPNVIIWAEDLKGNFVKKSFDVFNQNLLAGEIAGIVLGVILILFIIAAVIIAVILVKRRNQRNMIIPRARTGSR